MIGLLKNKSQYYMEKYFFLVRDGVQYPRIFPIPSRILIHFTQEMLPLLPKKLRTPYSRNLRVSKNGHHWHAHGPQVFVAAHQLNYAIKLENLQLPSEETALNFQYPDVSSCNTLFHGQNWSFQQVSAPAHKARTTHH